MSTPPAPAKTLALLLVDDDESLREAFALYYRALGLEVRTADCAEVALAAVRAAPPDVIVTDYAMPGMNGIDLLNALREDPDLPAIPCILLSGRDRDLRSVHGAPWLRKPIEPPALLDHIYSLLKDASSNP